MATKYYCDGCDAEIRKFDHGYGRQVSVIVRDKGKDVSEVNGEFDLCDSCARHLIEMAVPRQWIRCKPAA